jgi:hypothetical protein
MEDRIKELERIVHDNKLGSLCVEYTEMKNLTDVFLAKFETKMIFKNQTLVRRPYTFNRDKTSDEINNLFLRVVASIQQGNSITASVEHNGYNYNKFYSMINDEQRSSLINEKKLATLKNN